ncbi:MAG: hypothetical protein AAFX85_05515 [Pseudomonadota bacterium]
MANPGRKLPIEMLVASLAIIVSLAALFVSVLEVNVMRSEVSLMRAQERAAVWPYLELGITYDRSGFAVEVVNKGTGPALLQRVSVRTPDGTALTGWEDVLNALLPEDHGLTWSHYLSGRLSRTVLSPQEEVVAFRYPAQVTGDTVWTDTTRALANGLEALTWRVCYCSVLEDCWLRERDREPTPTAPACAESDTPDFTD